MALFEPNHIENVESASDNSALELIAESQNIQLQIAQQIQTLMDELPTAASERQAEIQFKLEQIESVLQRVSALSQTDLETLLDKFGLKADNLEEIQTFAANNNEKTKSLARRALDFVVKLGANVIKTLAQSALRILSFVWKHPLISVALVLLLGYGAYALPGYLNWEMALFGIDQYQKLAGVGTIPENGSSITF